MAIDLSTLVLSGYWPASYDPPTPILGVASAGTSLGNNLVMDTWYPAVGTALNDIDTMDCSGGLSLLTSDLTADVLGTTAWSFACLLYTESQHYRVGLVANPTLFTANVKAGVIVTDEGISAYAYDDEDTSHETTPILVDNATWLLVQARWDGADLSLRVNNGEWSTVACTSMYPGSVPITIGYNGYIELDGLLATPMFAKDIAWSDSDADDIGLAIQERFETDFGFTEESGGGDASGTIGTVTVSTPAGSALGKGVTSGTIGVVTVSTCTGAATGKGVTSGTIGTVTVSTLAGSALGKGVTSGTIGTVTVSTLAGTASGVGAGQATGSIGTVTISACTGTAVGFGEGIASGSIGTVTVSTLAGAAAGKGVTSGSIGTITVSTPTGAAAGKGVTSGAIGIVAVSAFAGAAAGKGVTSGQIGLVTVSAPTGSAANIVSASGAIGTVAVSVCEGTASGAGITFGSIGTVTVSTCVGWAQGAGARVARDLFGLLELPAQVPAFSTGLTVTIDAAAGTYARTIGSFFTDGFVVGQRVAWDGLTNQGNMTNKTITALTTFVMTVASAGLVNETSAAFGASVALVRPAITDPGLDRLLDFCRCVLNADLGDAWAHVAAADPVPVAHVFNHDPNLEDFNTNELPALYMWRADDSAGMQRMAQDLVSDDAGFQALWVPPPATYENRSARAGMMNGLRKSLKAAIGQGRHPAWVLEGDDYYEPEDYGSVLLYHAGFAKARFSQSRAHKLVIECENGGPKTVFDCIFFTIDTLETFAKNLEAAVATSDAYSELNHLEGTVTLPERNDEGLDEGATLDMQDFHVEMEVTAIDVASGPTAGGTDVTITGAQFIDNPVSPMLVYFGTAPSLLVQYVDETRIIARAPAHAAGSVDITVFQIEDGVSKTLANAFIYT